ncbi:MAG: GAF domain-containing protein [Spartobacteria bacterium]|nr:GAF domain-containing protein [Spartobacteria bacterium]
MMHMVALEQNNFDAQNSVASSVTVEPGALIGGRYEAGSFLGEGGMSVVYRCHDREHGLDVAIKFLKPAVTSSYADDRIRFTREMALLSRLAHAHIVKVLGSGEHSEVPFIVMELLPGAPLAQANQSGRCFSPAECAAMARQMAEALHYVHAQNILHRDISSGNVFLCRSEGHERAVLTDFGLSHVLELSALTSEPEVAGTFGYMSPEAAGILNKQADERSDLYSLGVVLYEMLSGRRPFTATERGLLLHQQAATIPPRPGGDPLLEAMVMKLIEKEPDLRYQSAGGVLHDLVRYCDGERGFPIAERDPKVKLSYQTSLIGRDTELMALKAMHEKARGGHTMIGFIVGEAGEGKTRMAEELRRYSYEQGSLFIGGRCLNQENKQPYQPFISAINTWIRAMERMDTARRREEAIRARAALGELGEVIERLNPHVQSVLGKNAPLVPLEPERENQRFLMVAARFFTSLGSDQAPCVLMLDDLQWADEGTLTLLEEIRRQAEPGRLLVVGTYRRDEVGESHRLRQMIQRWNNDHLNAEEINLAPFDKPRMRTLVASLLGRPEEDTAATADIVQAKSGGNPFFALYILREMVESKALYWDDGRWLHNEGKIHSLSISGSVADLLVKKSEDLPAELAALLETAAVIGRQFPTELLGQVLRRTPGDIVSLMDAAMQRQLVEPSGIRGQFLFAHDRIHEAFLSRLAPEALRQAHQNIAQTIEAHYNSGDLVNLYALAHHYTEAGLEDKMLEYVLPAANKARENYANEEAIHHYRAVLKILEAQGDSSPIFQQARLGLLEVCLLVNRNQEALDIADILLQEIGDRSERAEIYRKKAFAYFHMGHFKESEHAYFQALRELGEHLPVTTLGQLAAGLGHLLKYIGRSRLLLPWTKQLFGGRRTPKETLLINTVYHNLTWLYSLYKPLRFFNCSLQNLHRSAIENFNKEQTAIILWTQGVTFCFISFFKQGFAQIQRALQMELGREVQLVIEVPYGAFLSWAGLYRESLDVMTRTGKMAQEIGERWMEAMSCHVGGHCHYYPGDYSTALACFQNYWEISSRISDHQGISAATNYIALCHFEQGNVEVSKGLLQESLAISKEKAIPLTECESLLYSGTIALFEEQWDQAISLLKEAVAVEKGLFLLLDYAGPIHHTLAEAYIAKAETPDVKGRWLYLLKAVHPLLKGLLLMRRWPNHYAGALRVAGRFWSALGWDKTAFSFYQRSVAHAAKTNRRFEEARSRYEYALAVRKKGWHFEAEGQLQEALRLFLGIGAKAFAQKVQAMMDTNGAEVGAPATKPASTDCASNRLSEDRSFDAVFSSSRYLTTILDPDELLDKIVDTAIQLTGSRRGMLCLTSTPSGEPEDSEGLQSLPQLMPALVRDVDEEEARGISNSLMTQVALKRRSVVIGDTRDTSVQAQLSVIRSGAKCALCVPVEGRERLLGVLYLDNNLVEGLYAGRVRQAVEALASQAGILLENTRMVKELVEQDRLRQELKLGTQIQMESMPESAPAVEGLNVLPFMQPALEIGGDYYDFFVRALPEYPTRLGVAIGDVSGKGMGAGLSMAMLKTTVMTLSQEGFTLPEIITKTNSIMYQNLNEGMFVSLVYLEWDPAANLVRYCGAGHETILVYRQETRDVESITSGGIVLGILPEIQEMIDEQTFSLCPGDKIILYTDGVTEARNPRREEYGLEAMMALIQQHGHQSLPELLALLRADIARFTQGAEQNDDITILVMEHPFD